MSIQTTSQQFISPVDVSHHSPTKENPIPRSLINQWKTEGYALISGLFSTDLIGNARDQIQKLVAKNANVVSEDFGGLSFPFQDTRDQSEILLNPVNPLTAIVLNPIMLSLAKACLETEDIQMTQAEAWLKHCNLSSDRSVYSNQDQRIHMDYPNHTLLHPPSWEHPEVIAAILYLDDSDVCGGSTAVVANNGSGNKDPLYKMPYDRMPGVGSHRWLNDRAKTEEYFEVNDPDIFTFRQEIYKREKYVNFTMGSVLLYRHDVWHRGTPIKPGQTRIVINLAYKKVRFLSISFVTRLLLVLLKNQLYFASLLICTGFIELGNCMGPWIRI